MTQSRWWTLAVVAAVVVLSALVVLEQPPTDRLVGSLVSLAVFLLLWLLFGARALRQPRIGVALVVAIGIVTCFAVYFEASMATLQCIVYPIIWTILVRTRRAVLVNILFTIAIAVAMFFG